MQGGGREGGRGPGRPSSWTVEGQAAKTLRNICIIGSANGTTCGPSFRATTCEYQWGGIRGDPPPPPGPLKRGSPIPRTTGGYGGGVEGKGTRITAHGGSGPWRPGTGTPSPRFQRTLVCSTLCYTLQSKGGA